MLSCLWNDAYKKTLLLLGNNSPCRVRVRLRARVRARVRLRARIRVRVRLRVRVGSLSTMSIASLMLKKRSHRKITYCTM